MCSFVIEYTSNGTIVNKEDISIDELQERKGVDSNEDEKLEGISG